MKLLQIIFSRPTQYLYCGKLSPLRYLSLSTASTSICRASYTQYTTKQISSMTRCFFWRASPAAAGDERYRPIGAAEHSKKQKEGTSLRSTEYLHGASRPPSYFFFVEDV